MRRQSKYFHIQDADADKICPYFPYYSYSHIMLLKKKSKDGWEEDVFGVFRYTHTFAPSPCPIALSVRFVQSFFWLPTLPFPCILIYLVVLKLNWSGPSPP